MWKKLSNIKDTKRHEVKPKKLSVFIPFVLLRDLRGKNFHIKNGRAVII